MHERRRRKAEQPVQPDLPRCGGDQVRAAHHLGHAGDRVVHHDRELVGKHPVRPADDEIPALAREVFAVRAEHPVREADLLIRHAHARRRGARFALLRNLLGRQIATGARVDHAAVRQVRRGSRVQRRTRAEAGIQQPLFPQDGFIFLVNRRALGLIQDLPVPVQPQPAQVVEDQLRIAARAAQGIQILDPQQVLPALMPRAQPRQQRAQHVAEVHPPARAGRKASDGLHVSSSFSSLYLTISGQGYATAPFSCIMVSIYHEVRQR